MSDTVRVPRVNANEDEVQVVGILVKEGDRVAEGDLLVVVESTKASTEVLAPFAGTVRRITVKLEDMVAVGADLLEIDQGKSKGGEAVADGAAAEGKKISAKARKLAAELGVDLEELSAKGGPIQIADVMEAAKAKSSGAGGLQAVIIGGGGHAACIVDALQGSGIVIVGCTDEALPVGTEVVAGVKVLGKDDILPELKARGVSMAFIGAAGAVDNTLRRTLFDKATGLGFAVPALVHRSAVVGVGTVLASGTQVLAGVTIGARCRIGANAVINQGSIVCHDCTIGDDVHIAPGAILAGGIAVGADTTIGMGVTVLLGVKIGRGCLVHNGASIVGDVASNQEVGRQGERHPRVRK